MERSMVRNRMLQIDNLSTFLLHIYILIIIFIVENCIFLHYVIIYFFSSHSVFVQREFCIYMDGVSYLYGWSFVFVWMEFCICMDGILYLYGCNCTCGWLVPAWADNGRKGGEIKTNYFAKNP